MIKKILLFLVGLVVLVSAAATAVLPRHVSLERTTTIEAPASAIFPHLSDMKAWHDWNPWGAKDPNMKLTYGETTEGKGASYSWESETQGSGTMTVTELRAPNMLVTDLDFGDQGTAKSQFFLHSREDGKTEVAWNITCDMGAGPSANSSALC